MPENANAEQAVKPTGPRPGGKEDVARAIEFLMNFVIRWTLFFFFGVFGLLALAAWLRGWAWWVLIPAAALAVVCFVLGWSTKPRGKFASDAHGPMIIVPRSSGESTAKEPK